MANKICISSLASAIDRGLVVKLFLHQAGGLCDTGYENDPIKIIWNINYLLGHTFPSMKDLWDLYREESLCEGWSHICV